MTSTPSPETGKPAQRGKRVVFAGILFGIGLGVMFGSLLAGGNPMNVALIIAGAGAAIAIAGLVMAQSRKT